MKNKLVILKLFTFSLLLGCSNNIKENNVIKYVPYEEEEKIEEINLPINEIEPDHKNEKPPLTEEIEVYNLNDIDDSAEIVNEEILEEIIYKEKPDSVIQIGPFANNTNINIQEIIYENLLLIPNENIYSVSTHNDFGHFKLPQETDDKYLSLLAQGQYYNFYAGEYTNGNTLLKSFTSSINNESHNINILTTISYNRIRYLINQKHLSFERALSQSRAEILKAFNIHEEVSNFNQIRIDRESQESALLLALTLLIQGPLDHTQLNNFINRIAYDLENDGVINNENIIETLCHHNKQLNIYQITKNIEYFYQDHSIEKFVIPQFGDYLDSDCNGIINKNDQYSHHIISKPRSDQFMNMVGFTVESYQDKLWLVSEEGLFSSDDFDDWEQKESKDLSTSYPILIKLNNLLYIFGGQDCEIVLPNEEELCASVMGVYTLDENFNLEKIKERGMGDWRYDDFIEDRYDNFLDPNQNYIIRQNNRDPADNVFSNYSSQSNLIRILNHKLYASVAYQGPLISGYIINYGIGYYNIYGYYSSYTSRMSSNGIDWNQIENNSLRETFESRDDIICDIIQFKENIYLLKLGPGNQSNTCNLYKDIDPEESVYNFENIPYIGRRPIGDVRNAKSNIKFQVYEDKLYTTYYNTDNEIVIKYTSDGNTWNKIDIPTSFYQSELIHKVFIHKNMIQFITENEIISIGHYENYKEYISLN